MFFWSKLILRPRQFWKSNFDFLSKLILTYCILIYPNHIFCGEWSFSIFANDLTCFSSFTFMCFGLYRRYYGILPFIRESFGWFGIGILMYSMKEYDLTLNPNKCKMMAKNLELVGFHIGALGGLVSSCIISLIYSIDQSCLKRQVSWTNSY